MKGEFNMSEKLAGAVQQLADEEILSLRAEIDRLREVNGWVPVGARVPDCDKELFLVASRDSIGVAWWHGGPQEFIHEDIDNAWTPTHWMPLPEPPST